MKYDIQDFVKVANGKATIKEMCEFYCCSKDAFIIAMNRSGYYVRKTRIKIVSPYQTKIVYSCSACANELKVSERTIRNALKGKRVKSFEEMGITLCKVDYGDEEPL